MTVGFAGWMILLTLGGTAQPLPPSQVAGALVQQVNIFSPDGSDPRRSQSHAGADRMFAPIGRISTNRRVPAPDATAAAAASDRPAPLVNLDGTAFLVSPCYALTNYHVVFGGSRTPATNYTATLYTFAGDDAAMIGTLATPVMWGAMAHAQRPDNDWALLKLSDCIGSRIGWMELGHDDQNQRAAQAVTSIGFAADKDPSSLWRDDCQLYHGAPGEFLDDCAIAEGSSGSPIMLLRQGRPQVIALSEGELNERDTILTGYASQFANVASDVRSIAPSAVRLIAADIAAFGLPNPAEAPAD